ncbi:hypothetical protein V494_03237 [Pseudogymnoascus sp. VKM F-4513 (FW-928)]|nr:hypothetical protein V494_03237 [Pseudogymnoascus sp. VKM F-4513 (FW-928)]
MLPPIPPSVEDFENSRLVGTQLHNLDLGVARFANLELSFVLRQAFDVEVLKSTALNLVKTWPALSERMYLTRYGFSPSKDPELEGMWNARTIDSTLNEALPYLKDAPRVVDSTLLDKLLTFDTTLKEQLYPRALSISVASLKDACLIKFVIQHTFCDASGLYRIVEAYCRLLSGGTIRSMKPRVPLDLADEDTHDPKAPPEPSAERCDGYFAHGWGALVGAAWTQWRNQRQGPNRVVKTAMIPNFVIDKLAKEAEAEGIRVTRHDLLMAWIYVATMPEIPTLAQKKAAGPPQFSFTLNIARQLKENSDFHNPWILVISPDVEATELSARTPIIASAKHFRSVISDVRRPEPVRQIIRKHDNVRSTPLGFKDWGSIEPNVTLSSWTNLPMYDLEFASPGGSKVSPEFVQITILACPLVGMLGASVADAILTWVSKDGFWLQGTLDEKLWKRIVDFSKME